MHAGANISKYDASLQRAHSSCAALLKQRARLHMHQPDDFCDGHKSVLNRPCTVRNIVPGLECESKTSQRSENTKTLA
eukprot:670185-Amphidinium_carterae.1